jgi:hypothetical protein
LVLALSNTPRISSLPPSASTERSITFPAASLCAYRHARQAVAIDGEREVARAVEAVAATVAVTVVASFRRSMPVTSSERPFLGRYGRPRPAVGLFVVRAARHGDCWRPDRG